MVRLSKQQKSTNQQITKNQLTMGKEELSAGGSSSDKAEEDGIKQPKTEIDGPGPESEQNGKVRVKRGKVKFQPDL